jgi:hypothetical protein
MSGGFLNQVLSLSAFLLSNVQFPNGFRDMGDDCRDELVVNHVRIKQGLPDVELSDHGGGSGKEGGAR